MRDITIHPLRGPVSSLTLVPFPNRCGTATKSTPFGTSILPGTPPCVYPLRGTARRMTHHPVSGSNTICNDPEPPLEHIVFFGLSLLGFPSRLQNRPLGEGFHTLIQGVLFSSPTTAGHHNFEFIS